MAIFERQFLSAGLQGSAEGRHHDSLVRNAPAAGRLPCRNRSPAATGTLAFRHSRTKAASSSPRISRASENARGARSVTSSPSCSAAAIIANCTNWYPSKALHGKVVPTWNYAVVVAYGRPEVIKKRLAAPPRNRAYCPITMFSGAGELRTSEESPSGSARLRRVDRYQSAWKPLRHLTPPHSNRPPSNEWAPRPAAA